MGPGVVRIALQQYVGQPSPTHFVDALINGGGVGALVEPVWEKSNIRYYIILACYSIERLDEAKY